MFPGVERLLNQPADGRYWVAEIDNEIVGQIMVTYEWSDWRNGRVWWIQSVYVHPDHRRSGVFSALYEHVASLVRQDPDAVGIRLYMEENNARAQATYETLGMAMTPYRVTPCQKRIITNEGRFADAATLNAQPTR